MELYLNVAGLLNSLLTLLRKSNELRFGRRQLAGPLAVRACEGTWQMQDIICNHILPPLGKNGLNPHAETTCFKTQQPFMCCRGWLGASTVGIVGPGPPLLLRSSVGAGAGAAVEGLQVSASSLAFGPPLALAAEDSLCVPVPAEAAVMELEHETPA